jgi:O-antigen/teichoic acid export membrane protein
MIRAPQRGGFARNVMEMATGTAIAQVAPLLVTPILTRLFTPAQFGEFGIFTALLLGLSIVASGRYEVAVPIPRSERTAFDLVALSILITVGFSVLVLFLGVGATTLFGGALIASLDIREMAVLLLPFGVLFASVMQSCSYWLTRTGQFAVVARTRSAQGLITAASGVFLGMAGVSSGLLLSLLVGYVVGSVALVVAVLASHGHLVRLVTAGGLRAVLVEHRGFALLNGGNALIDLIRESGTLVAFGGLFGAAATGFLSQALRILRAPVTLIGQAVAQVFFPAVSRVRNDGGSARDLTARTMKSVLLISVPLYLVVLLAGPWLFGFVLGEQWVEAGVYARILAPWLMLVLAASSLSLLPVAFDVQHKALGLNAIETTVRFAGLLIGGAVGGPVGAVAGMAIGGVATGGVQLAWYWRLSGQMPSESPPPAQGVAG